MNSPNKSSQDELKREAAVAAAALVVDGMVVGLGTGSTAAFAIEELARRSKQGLRFVGIPTSERTAAQAAAAGIPLSTLDEHPRIDLTIDGADEVERGTLNVIKGHGGALLHEKIVAAASTRLAIIVDDSKLVDRLGAHVAVPVEVVTFGLEATRVSLQALGASVKLRAETSGEPFVTDSGNRILDCNFGEISDPATLDDNIRRCIGVVVSGLFINLAHVAFVASARGVEQMVSPRVHPNGPPILVVMGVSGSGKTTIARDLASRLGWAYKDGDALHSEANIARMAAGFPLTDADREPWLGAVAAWIDRQRAREQPGIISCSALKRAYRQVIIGDRPNVRLAYVSANPDLIAERLTARLGHFMPPSLLQSQLDTLEEPGLDEHPIVVNADPSPEQIASEIIGRLGTRGISEQGALDR